MAKSSQFSLRYLFIAMGVVAVCLAMLANPNEWCWSIASTGKVLLLASAIPMAVLCQPTRRAFWLTFAIAGWIFQLMAGGALERVGISNGSFLPFHIINLAPEEWRLRDFFYQTATDISILLMALLAGLLCHWLLAGKSEEVSSD